VSALYTAAETTKAVTVPFGYYVLQILHSRIIAQHHTTQF